MNNNNKHYPNRKSLYIITLFRIIALCQCYIVIRVKVTENEHFEIWQKVWYTGIINVSVFWYSKSRNILIIH